MDRESILRRLEAQVNIHGHILGAAVGSGMTARYASMGGADFLLALSAGRYRIMGRSSYASYLCCGNSNEIVMDIGTRELLPIIRDVPILFGLLASDPFIDLEDHMVRIKELGFSGVVNFPTLSLIDGAFRQALEAEGNTYSQEVEAIRIARKLDLFTVAFVTNEEEARSMLEAGADVICAHLGLTRGGFLGAKNFLPLENARKLANRIFRVCEDTRPEALRMIYAGPASSLADMQYLYRGTSCQGYIGGSTFERIPIESAVYETTRAFKNSGDERLDTLIAKVLEGGWAPKDYTDFVRQFIAERYAEDIRLGDLALVMHLSPSYLSTRFRKDTGTSFSEYLIRFRLEKAKELLRSGTDSCRQVAENVGYSDYAHFSKLFKKYEGLSPMEYRSRSMEE